MHPFLALAAVMRFHHFGHHHGGIGGLIVRSAIWHTVGRFLWHVPTMIVLVVVVAAVAAFATVRRRRTPRRS